MDADVPKNGFYMILLKMGYPKLQWFIITLVRMAICGGSV